MFVLPNHVYNTKVQGHSFLLFGSADESKKVHVGYVGLKINISASYVSMVIMALLLEW